MEREIRQSIINRPPKYNVDTEVVDPQLVVDDARQCGQTVQSQLLRDPYYVAATIAYDKLRFDHQHIRSLHVLLITLAQYRFLMEKRPPEILQYKRRSALES